MPSVHHAIWLPSWDHDGQNPKSTLVSLPVATSKTSTTLGSSTLSPDTYTIN
jgi:hypothetical protein